jgi:phosphoglycolate phosphatase
MTKSIERPTAILFDWDNTLVNTFPVIYQGLCDVFVKMGMEPWSLDDVKNNRENIHNSLRESFPRIFGEERWEEARATYYESFLANHLKKMEVLPGAVETLYELSSKDIFIAIVSNKTGKYLRKEVEFLGWDNYFDRVVGSMDAEKDKPNADPAHLALSGSGIEADEKVLFIGDSSADVECALNAGLTPVIFDEHIFQQPQKEGVDINTFLHVKNHKDLLSIVESF